MKLQQFITATILFYTLLLAGCNPSEEFNDELVEQIRNEIGQATLDKDFATLEKYFYQDTVIYLDMDPANNRGEMKMTYEQFMPLLKMGLTMIEDMEILHDELLSITYNNDKSQVTIEEKSTISSTTMGVTYAETSISETTFGFIEGEIKILEMRDLLVNSEVIPQ